MNVDSISLIFLKFEVKLPLFWHHVEFWDEPSWNNHCRIEGKRCTGVLLTLFLQVIYVHVITSCSEVNTLKKLPVFIQSMNRWEMSLIIVILNRWELLLAWMACEMFMSSDELWIACQGAITPLWSPMNSHWHLLLYCALWQHRVLCHSFL